MYKLTLHNKAWTWNAEKGTGEHIDVDTDFTCFYLGELQSLLSCMVTAADDKLTFTIAKVEEDADA